MQGVNNKIKVESNISLVYAEPKDQKRAYIWLCQSDITPLMMGPPCFPNHPIPSYEEFCSDYELFYFDGSKPDDGRCFIIVKNGLDIGIISYTCFYLRKGCAELDIWLNSKTHFNKGYGPIAIMKLCDLLSHAEGISTFILRPAENNLRAIRAYKKAGFKEKRYNRIKGCLKPAYLESFFNGDYGPGGTILMIRKF